MTKGHRIEKLQKEVEEQWRRAKDEREKRKATEASHQTLKDELARVH